jgi:heterotetrameric sarcosine oxidase gamma subunit
MADRDAVQVTALCNRTVVALKAWETGDLSHAPVPSDLGGKVQGLRLQLDEWLLVSDQIDGSTLCEHLQRSGHTKNSACVDLSSGVKALRVAGPFARDILSKGCGLDLRTVTFLPGHCTRTRFAQLPVIIHYPDPRPYFDLYISRSYLDYLQSYLQDAALEFQHPQKQPRALRDGYIRP